MVDEDDGVFLPFFSAAVAADDRDYRAGRENACFL